MTERERRVQAEMERRKQAQRRGSSVAEGPMPAAGEAELAQDPRAIVPDPNRVPPAVAPRRDLMAPQVAFIVELSEPKGEATPQIVGLFDTEGEAEQWLFSHEGEGVVRLIDVRSFPRRIRPGPRQATDRKAEVYADAKGEWRWRVVAANGNIVADSGEGYANKGHAIRMVRSLFPSEPMILHKPGEAP